MEIKYHINEIDDVARKVAKNLSNKVVIFYGEMGAGKTTLIKALAKCLGSRDIIQSPTYSIVNEYEADDRNIYHFDFYRIKNESEALNLGFEDYLADDNFIFIEWPQIILDLIPEIVDVITITNNENTSRTLKLSQNINLTKQKLMTQPHIS